MDLGKTNKDNNGEIWKVKEISRDHKPELPDEKERILANNGRVERFTSKLVFFITSFRNEFRSVSSLVKNGKLSWLSHE